MSDIYYSLHAQKVMAERGVTREEVEAVIRNPQVTYRGRSNSEDSRVVQNSDLGVVIAPQEGGDVLVVTILWRVTNQWDNDEMRDSR